MQVFYYTDPACPWSWALEPAIRRLEGRGRSVRYVMTGLAREFGNPLEQISAQLNASEASGMPVDPRLWLEGPPSSSYPACIAVKAAAEQGDPGAFLRRLRQGFMCRRRKLDTAEALVEEARAISGLDLARFRIDLGSHAILEAFGADLGRTREAGVASPALEFEDGRVVSGFAEIEAQLANGPAGTLSPIDALRLHGPLATPEIEALCDLPGPRAPAELWRLATEWRAKAERVGSGELWSLA